MVGRRGLAYVAGLRSCEGVQVSTLCDLDASAETLGRDSGVEEFTVDFERMLDQVDAVVIATPMHLHAPQTLAALGQGKAVLSEVTAAVTVDECLALSQAGGIYFFAENYCYFRQNLIAREIAARGLFGQLYYGEGDYVHEVRFLHRDGQGQPTWRMEWQVGRRGNTYCTHELGPLMRAFRAQEPGVKIKSVACFGTGTHTDTTLNHDDNTLTLVRLDNGGLLKLRLDMVSNRPHSIRYELQGVLGAFESDHSHRVWIGDNRSVHWDDAEQRRWQDLDTYADLLPDSLREDMKSAEQHGHGGGDFLVGRRFAQTLTQGVPPEIGKFEGVEWTMVGLLSQQSILQGGMSLSMPDWVYA